MKFKHLSVNMVGRELKKQPLPFNLLGSQLSSASSAQPAYLIYISSYKLVKEVDLRGY